MHWIGSNLLAAIAAAQPDGSTRFEMFLKSFRQHFEDQRALLPLLGLGLLIAAVIAADIFIGLRLARGSRHHGPKNPSAH